MKRLVGFAALVVSAYVARRVVSMRDAMAAVAPELRNPILPLLPDSYTPLTFSLTRLGMRLSTKPGTGVTVTERYVDSEPAVRVLVTTPSAAGEPRPAVLLMHGGGMVVGSPQFEAFQAGHLARELDAVVISPDYRLAPEHPFPAALDDCMATMRWMRSRADELGIDADRIAVTGSSAGGGLSAAVAQRGTDEGITLRAQVLVYPMLDDRTALRGDHAGRGKFMWTPASSRWAWTAYLGREPQMSDPPEYAAPARRTDLSGLPAAWVGVGDLDILNEEGVAYAERLEACGVPCELVTVLGMYHGADGIKRKVPSMRAFRRGATEHLRTYL